MTENEFPVTRNIESQEPIPTEWRPKLAAIVEAIKDGSLQWSAPQGLRALGPQDALKIEESIANYGVTLGSLPAEAWTTSACQWMGGYWDILIDLFSEEEGSSDLVMSLRAYDVGPNVEFELISVHVP